MAVEQLGGVILANLCSWRDIPCMEYQLELELPHKVGHV